MAEGGATSAGALSALTVKTTVVAADRLSPRSESERDKESDTTCVEVSVRPFRAAFRLSAEPDTGNDADPLAPVVTLKPVGDASASVPGMTVSVRGFAPLPVLAPLARVALPLFGEKTSDPFWPSVLAGGATIGGVLSVVTVTATVGVADGLSPRSGSETDNDSDPTCVTLTLEVGPLRAVLRLAVVLVVVNEGETFVPAVRLNPVVGD